MSLGYGGPVALSGVAGPAHPGAMERARGATPVPESPREELTHGSDRMLPRLPRWARLAVQVGLVALVASVAVGHLAAGSGPQPGPGVWRGPEVSVGAVGPEEDACVRTDGRSWLDVSFVLANTGSVAVTLQKVWASLPIAGLEPTGAILAGGTCSRHTPQPWHRRLDVGRSALVTLTFALPASCPQPIPMEATLVVETDKGKRSTHVVPVLQDLGQLPLVRCHAPTGSVHGAYGAAHHGQPRRLVRGQPAASRSQASGHRRVPGGTRRSHSPGPAASGAIRCPAQATTPVRSA